jgi:hypothetical protein
MSDFWSADETIKSELAADKAATEDKLARTARAVIAAWAPQDCEVYFDKSRGWLRIHELMQGISPASIIFAMVRDPREVCASVLRRHREFPLLDTGRTTVFERASTIFEPTGLVGGPMRWMEDVCRVKPPNVVPVIFERLSEDPEREMRKLYAEMKREYWPGHDFEAVRSTARDLDAQWLYKFPHKYEGERKVARPKATWPEVVPGDVARAITERYPLFCTSFGYGG